MVSNSHPVDSGLREVLLKANPNPESYCDTTAPVSVGGLQLSLSDCRIMCNQKGQDGWLWKAAQNKGDQSPVEFSRSIHLKAN